jgi:predicted short-subunit dehydrogenase-like oxidoreductase (DUF2520 family)
MKPRTFAIIGCGKVGITLAWHLAHIGYVPDGFASRRSASAHAAAENAGGGRVCRDPWEAAADADAVFITTPDATIGSVAECLAERKGVKRGAVVLHCSGALSSDIIAGVRHCGAHVGSLHPLQSFAAPTFPQNPFRGIIMAGEGDDKALALAREITSGFQAVFLKIETEHKTLYHAAAVMASNYLVTLLAASTQLLEGSGIAPEETLNVLLPLVRGTLNNIEKRGVAGALTGPIARGDVDTVGTHCRKIGQSLPDMLPFYQLLGRYTLPLATAQGALDADRRDALATLLQRS